jgi:SpoVK/Ycf46/Vps4 family AAA+-type ATPase
LLPDHRAWFEDATSFISQSTDTLSPQAQAEGYKGESVHLNEMKENVERSILPATQQVPLWDEIAAPEDIKADLWCSIMLPAIYSSVSQRRLQAILLHGAPGNGKTRLVQAISRLADIPLFHIDPTHVFQKYQEESEK